MVPGRVKGGRWQRLEPSGAVVLRPEPAVKQHVTRPRKARAGNPDLADLVPRSTRRPPGDDAPDLARTLDTLATAVMILVTLAILYFAREILIPVAIAVILSFVLSPLVKLMRRLGLGKKLAVGLAVVVTFTVTVGLGAILAKQISDLADDATRYQATVSQKVAGVRNFAANNPLLARLNSAIADMDPHAPDKADKPKPTRSATPAAAQDQATAPTRVEIVEPPPGLLTLLQTAAGMAATPLATAAFVAVFIIFILMQREDLRNRLIRLAGSSDLQRTTLALNDAARRLSRYFLAQVLLNAGFGIVTAVVLTFIGVPGAILWGIVAFFLRFIPYVGSIGSALFPVLLSLAASPGWTMAVETAVFFVAFELVVGQVVEPLVYGHNTGISPFAVVLSATFWTWLWGPVGLVLATPLTVCVVVMGRHIDRLGFLDVLLGDAPPLTDVESFYQRMLSGDASEVLDHADRYLAEHSLLDYCDAIAMKALLMAQDDVRRGALSEDRQLRIRDTMRDLAEDLVDRGEDSILPVDDSSAPASLAAPEPDAAQGDPEEELPDTSALDDAWTRDGAIVCIAGRTPLDEAAAHLLADLLQQRGFGTRVEAAKALADAGGAVVAGHEPKLVILSFLDADLSVGQARFAVRRLRRRLGNAPLVAAFWMSEDDEGRISGLCRDVRADVCVSGLPQAVRLCLERGAASGADEDEHEGSARGEFATRLSHSVENMKTAV